MENNKDKMKPPAHPRATTKSWFSNVLDAYELDEHHIKLLTRCCECFDRGDEAREAIAKHGLTFTDKQNGSAAYLRLLETQFAFFIAKCCLD
jgi:phage terminase small subunit